MIIALPTMHAVHASFGVCADARAARCARSLVLACLLGGAAAGAIAGPGDQQGPGREGPGRGDDARAQQMMQNQDRARGDSRMEQRISDPRSYDTRADDQRRAQQAQEQSRSDVARRNNRMTPDERRDLRRQINEAGQDLYSNPPRR